MFVLCSHDRWMAAREMSADAWPFRLEERGTEG